MICRYDEISDDSNHGAKIYILLNAQAHKEATVTYNLKIMQCQDYGTMSATNELYQICRYIEIFIEFGLSYIDFS